MAAAPRDEEAARWVWGGEVLLQVHLHDADVTALPPPPPFLTLGRRNGYFPLLVSIIKAHFSTSLPPGVDTVWFEYKGLPLKWYIPIGVLFDLLCAEPERPWNLTVHFRGYPADILSPCEGEDSVKWNYNNSLKEAAFIITGNSKNVMNMSQADQLAMWESVRKRDADGYMNISAKLKLGPFEDYFWTSSLEPRQGSDEPESPGSVKPWYLFDYTCAEFKKTFEYLEDAIPVSDWESVSYINRPFEIRKEGGRSYIALEHALETLLPEFFSSKATAGAADPEPAAAMTTPDSEPDDSDTSPGTPHDEKPASASPRETDVARKTKLKLVRVQGIELDMDIPFLWVANNLKNPECFLHVCVYVGA